MDRGKETMKQSQYGQIPHKKTHHHRSNINAKVFTGSKYLSPSQNRQRQRQRLRYKAYNKDVSTSIAKNNKHRGKSNNQHSQGAMKSISSRYQTYYPSPSSVRIVRTRPKLTGKIKVDRKGGYQADKGASGTVSIQRAAEMFNGLSIIKDFALSDDK